MASPSFVGVPLSVAKETVHLVPPGDQFRDLQSIVPDAQGRCLSFEKSISGSPSRREVAVYESKQLFGRACSPTGLLDELPCFLFFSGREPLSLFGRSFRHEFNQNR